MQGNLKSIADVPMPLIVLIILIDGYVTIAIELLTIRQLIPVVGSSVLMTSCIIGFFMLFLAYGYRRGGEYTSSYTSILTRNFTLAASLIAIGLSSLFIDKLFYFLNAYLSSNLLLETVIYLLLITCPLVYILGQTLPIVTNLFLDGRCISAISSKVLYINTLGSCFGSLGTALILMNLVGVAWTIFLTFCLLLCLILFLIDYKNSLLRLIFLASVSVFLCLMTIKVSKIDKNDYEFISLAQKHAPIKFETRQKDNFWPMSHPILSDFLNKSNKKLAINMDQTQLKFLPNTTYVRVDEIIQGVSKQVFDVVLLDGSRDPGSVSTVLTPKYLRSLRQLLTSTGTLVLNVFATPMFTDSNSLQMDKVIRKIFPNCRVLIPNYSQHSVSMTYLCTKSNEEKDTTTYTDDKNSVTLDYF